MSTDTTRYYPCTGCGAKLEFAPGQQALKCPFCGAENAIAAATTAEKAQADAKLDFLTYLREQAGSEPTLERQTVKCPSCGAASQLPANVTADRCPFCAAPLVAGDAYSVRLIQPRAIAPFQVTESAARQSFKQWLSGLWFAPNALKQAARAESGLKGIYLPYWTYDSNSDTSFVGERGEIYFEDEVYFENGEEKVRRVERIRWWPVSGEVNVQFADVLVPASPSVPQDYADGLAPWHLEKLAPYRDDYVSGFTVEAYQTGLEPGFGLAQQKMEVVIREAICRQIGGNQQRILSMSPTYFDIRFKHILLPIWLSSYRYANKTYRFIVNGQTGSVQGERPWSAWKLASVAIATLLLTALLLHHLHIF